MRSSPIGCGQNPLTCRDRSEMELGGLEPPTSWVRSTDSPVGVGRTPGPAPANGILRSLLSLESRRAELRQRDAWISSEAVVSRTPSETLASRVWLLHKAVCKNLGGARCDGRGRRWECRGQEDHAAAARLRSVAALKTPLADSSPRLAAAQTTPPAAPRRRSAAAKRAPQAAKRRR
jgi:hypothetical protein